MPMNPYKEQLTAELVLLTEELKTIGIHDASNPQDWIAIPEEHDSSEADPNLVADVVENWGERQSLVATLERRYNDIMRALRKIESGQYGTCEIDSAPIEPERLRANPGARTCMAHMEEENGLSL